MVSVLESQLQIYSSMKKLMVIKNMLYLQISEFSPNDLVITTKTGQNYFIRQYIKFGFFVDGARLELINANKGMRAVSKLELAEKGNCSK